MRSIGAVTAALFLSLAVRPIPVTAQERPILEPRLSFEVASVKVNSARTRAPMLWQPGGHFVGSLSVLSFVSIGYQVPVYRIEGLPDWARTTRFLVNARANQPQPEFEERSAYFRGLLVNRFHLAADVERREMDVYSEGSVPTSLLPISTALEDQLGLKMQTGRGSIDVLVIDRLDMPTEN